MQVLVEPQVFVPVGFAAQATPVVFSVLLNGTRWHRGPMSSVRIGKASQAVSSCIESLVDQKDLDQVGWTQLPDPQVWDIWR